MLLQGDEAHDSQGPIAVLLCTGVRSPVTARKVLTGIVGFKNVFLLWAHAAYSELRQNETNRLVSSRVSEAQFPADLCSPFPLHGNLSFPFPSPPFSLAVPLTHFPVPLRTLSSVLAACVRPSRGSRSFGWLWVLRVLAGQDAALVTQLSTKGSQTRHFSSAKLLISVKFVGSSVLRFPPSAKVETNPKSRDRRHCQTGSQHDIINLKSVGSQAKHKHPRSQTPHTCSCLGMR